MTQDPNPYAAPQSDLWPAGQANPGNVIFGDAPIATFRSVLDRPWFERAYARWSLAYWHYSAGWRTGLLVSGVVVFIAFLSISNVGQGISVRLVHAFLVGAMISLPLLVVWSFSRWSAKSTAVKQFTRSKDFGVAYTFALYREGFVSSGPVVVTARRWIGFVSSRRFSDGILIMLDTNQFHWLPWSDLVSGQADDVEAILQTNIADYKEVRN
jgi:hypothetical protein